MNLYAEFTNKDILASSFHMEGISFYVPVSCIFKLVWF